ncbi:MAG: ABC transporter ATP-binding protein [Acidimicrobiales bacterium]
MTDESLHPGPAHSARKVVGLSGCVVVLGEFPALANATFDAYEGELVLLFGPNGSGKSTLLRTIAGLATPRRGSAIVFGQDLSDDDGRRAVRRSVNYVGHEALIYDDLTVGENLEFAARATRTPRARFDELLERFELPSRLVSVSVRRLSAGQRRKVTLVAGLGRRGELLLLDEPHASLDQRTKALLDTYLHESVREHKTVIYASHEVRPEDGIATRSVEIRSGVVVGNQS